MKTKIITINYAFINRLNPINERMIIDCDSLNLDNHAFEYF